MSQRSHLITDQGHLDSLEGWRGVLALMVVFLHFSVLLFGSDWFPYGYLAVDFFFMMSGFIIARQYEAKIATHRVSFKTFAVRRMARLYPLFLATVGFAYYMNEYMMDPYTPFRIQEFGIGPDFIGWAIMQLLMLGILSNGPQPNGPAWSVSTEWLVNIIFFVMVWRWRRIPNLLLWVVVFLGIVYLMGTSFGTLNMPAKSTAIGRGIVGFAMGWLMFRYHQSFPKLSLPVLYAAEAMLLVFAALLLNHYHELLPYGFDFIVLICLIPPLFIISLYRHGIICFFMSLPVIKFLGRISYSIYLVHYPLAFYLLINRVHESMGYTQFGIFYVAALMTICICTYTFIELPGRWIGRRMLTVDFRSAWRRPDYEQRLSNA